MVAGSHRDSLLAGRRGRAVVDVATGGNRCADTLSDDPLDDHDALTSFVAQPHLITGPHWMRGLDPYPVDPDVPRRQAPDAAKRVLVSRTGQIQLSTRPA